MPRFTQTIAIAAVFWATFAPNFATIKSPSNVHAVEIADLQDQLENGLEAKTPAQIAFIEKVVAKVDSGALPLSMVYATFKWARPKEPRPFPYFYEAIRLQARKYNVNL